MAKACAYLCRQCCFINGFGEFGEFTHSLTYLLTYSFLANVNSCSRSLYVVVRPSVCLSVCLSSVCLWSVTFMHPTQAIEIFGNVSMPFGTLAICDLLYKFYGDRPRGTPPSKG